MARKKKEDAVVKSKSSSDVFKSITKAEITRNRKQIEEVFSHITGKKRVTLDLQIEELAFTMACLRQSREILISEGVMEWYENGQQKHWREHPACKAHNESAKRMITLTEKMSVHLQGTDEKKVNALEMFNKKVGGK